MFIEWIFIESLSSGSWDTEKNRAEPLLSKKSESGLGPGVLGRKSTVLEMLFCVQQ